MKKMTVDLQGCARCGGNHRALKFLAFSRPAGAFTHYGTCPKKKQPILLKAEQMESEPAAEQRPG